MKSSSIVISKKLFFGIIAILLVFVVTSLFAFIKRPAAVAFMPSTEPTDSVYSVRIHPPVFPKQADFCGEATNANVNVGHFDVNRLLVDFFSLCQ
jgi:hypothetical protein